MTWVLGLLPLILLVLGFPIFLVLVATSSVVLMWYMNVPLTQIHLTMFGSVNNYALLAVPFFIFAGELMGRGGISHRLVQWVMSIIGGVRGSLPLTAVGTNAIFGAIAGSSLAAVASVGRLLYPTLREAGYDDRFASGLLASSGALAVVIPPSITMILYGAVAEQSIAQLFIAGVFPGLLIALVTAVYILGVAGRQGLQHGQRFEWGRFARATRQGIWSLGTPVIILGGIYLGVFSPTESGGVACVYAIAVTLWIHRDIGLWALWDVAVKSVYLTAQVLIIVAAAGTYSWLLTVSGLPQQLVAFIETLQLLPWQTLIVLNAVLLVVGCFVDPASAILVLTPLVLPIVRHVGVDPVHFGVIMSVNLSIGMFTPPFGLNIFAAQAAFGVPLRTVYRGLAPFIVINLLALLVVTYVPWLSLYLTQFVR